MFNLSPPVAPYERTFIVTFFTSRNQDICETRVSCIHMGAALKIARYEVGGWIADNLHATAIEEKLRH